MKKNAFLMFSLLEIFTFLLTPAVFAQRSTRIVGGNDAASGAWPWMTALVTTGDTPVDGWYCGGALIHAEWVVTAAHCVLDDFGKELSPDDLEVIVGIRNLKNNNEGERIGVKRIIVHPDYYFWGSDDSDIALLELDIPSTRTPLAIYSGTSDLSGEIATIIGWGKLSEYGKFATTLQEAQVPIVSNETCNDAYNKSFFYDNPITSTMLCAGYAQGGTDSCSGDSGGPLMINLDGEWNLAGLVSWGEGCAEPGYYGVYSRISVLSRFIAQYVPAGIPSVRLWFPHIAVNSEWQTEVALINIGTETVSGTLRAFDASGGEAGSLEITLEAGGRQEISVGSVFPAAENIRYMSFESDATSLTGYFKFWTEGKYRAAIPAVSDTNTGEFYISHIAANAEWWTGITLLNTGTAAKTLQIGFNTGDSKSVYLEPGEQQAFTMRQLFSGNPPSGLESAIVSNGEDIIGLELFGSMESSGNYYLGGILLRDQTASAIYYPHVANDTSWWTGVVAYNPSSRICNLEITPFTLTGLALSPISISLGGYAKYIGTAEALDLPEGTAWFSMNTSRPVTGFELFATRNGQQMGGYTGVNISRKSGIFPKVDSAGWTGIAFVNPGTQTAAISLTAYRNDGVSVAQKNIQLASHEKKSEFAETFFDGNISDAGYIRYDADQEIVGFQLNGSPDDMMLDALPALDAGN